MTAQLTSAATDAEAADEPAGTSQRARAALRSPGFTRLTVAWACTNFSDSVLALILAVWVKDLTGSDAMAGLLLATFGLPALVSPLLGQLVDRVSRRKLMAIIYVIGAVGLLPLLAVRDAEHAWIIYAVTTLYATIGYATASAQSGLVRDMMPDDALAAANGRLTSIDQLFRLAMPLVGAGVYLATGPHLLVVAAAAAFLVGAGVIASIHLVETPPAADADREPFRQEVLAGFRHLARVPSLSRITLAIAVSLGVVGALNTTNFATIEQGLGRGPSALAVLASVQGVSSVAAGLTASRVIARLGTARTVSLGLALAALGVFPLAGSSLVAVTVGLLLAGAGITWAMVGFITERQLRTPNALQGRVASATHLITSLPQTAMTVVAAAIIGVVDYRIMVLTVAVVVLLSALLPLRALRPRPQHHPAHDAHTAADVGPARSARSA
ncbi:MAG: MFS transporter [Cellulomonadaceae bacterium]